VGQLWADVRRSLRSMPRRLGLTVVVVVTLGLGIGANTAVFSFVWGILLRPFPYPEPQDLVRVYSVSQKDGGRESGASLLDVEDWGRESPSLLAVGAYVEGAKGDTERFAAVRAEASRAPDLFRQRVYLETLDRLMPLVRVFVTEPGEGGTRLRLVQPAPPKKAPREARP
jgi:hypothetical protein